MSISIDLTGLTALVTGSSQGIGAATVRTLHRSGARVVINHPDSSGGQVAEDAQRIGDELNLREKPAPSSASPMSAILSPCKG